MKFELEVVKFNVSDVITSSTCPTDLGGDCPNDD